MTAMYGDFDSTLPLPVVDNCAQNGFATSRQDVSMRLIDMGISHTFTSSANAVVFQGNCLDLLASMPDGSAQLVVTSPPYNIGKEYEDRRGRDMRQYWHTQKQIVKECYRVLSLRGSLCWQVGNYIDPEGARRSIYPLDIVLDPAFRRLGLKLRNRIVWHFEHGLNCR